MDLSSVDQRYIEKKLEHDFAILDKINEKLKTFSYAKNLSQDIKQKVIDQKAELLIRMQPFISEVIIREDNKVNAFIDSPLNKNEEMEVAELIEDYNKKTITL